jgi:pyruvate/2-oxoglutarate dehydrogenase complex dihydrolipoamide dehydrogenase (E3) component
MTGKRDLIVIGGGPGGLVVASVAAQAGLKVTLVEKTNRLGGDCLQTGCVPSKALIHAAHTAHTACTGAKEGLLSAMPDINFEQAIAQVEQAIATIQAWDDPERFRAYGCDVRFGKAQFVSPDSITVDDTVIRGRRFVIATGSRPALPPIPLLEQAGFETSDSILRRHDRPAHLTVIGGGPIGVEFAQAFARLGSKVTLIEMAERLLPAHDPEVSTALQQTLESEGIEVITGVLVAGVHREGETRQLRLSDDALVETNRILVATGRRPVLHGLGLEAAGVEYSNQGISVDRRLRTSQKHIYAVGDVCGPYPFTHMAEYQAGIALANIVFRIPRKTDYRVVPQVIYTDPEVASVGLTETEAVAQGLRYRVACFPLTEVDRAITDRARTGFARLLLRRGRILGASLVGPRAGELVHELALAMRVRAKVREISELVHAYPTYSQIHRRAINSNYAHLLRTKKVRSLVWLLQRVLP